MSEPNRSATERGFTIYDEFTDRYGAVITVQESSLATEPGLLDLLHGRPDAAPHLTVGQARRVGDALDAFIAEAGDG